MCDHVVTVVVGPTVRVCTGCGATVEHLPEPSGCEADAVVKRPLPSGALAVAIAAPPNVKAVAKSAILMVFIVILLFCCGASISDGSNLCPVPAEIMPLTCK